MTLSVPPATEATTPHWRGINRICDLAGPGEVLVSETVKGHLVGSGLAMSEQGHHVLKGVPQTWTLFAVGV